MSQVVELRAMVYIQGKGRSLFKKKKKNFRCYPWDIAKLEQRVVEETMESESEDMKLYVGFTI